MESRRVRQCRGSFSSRRRTKEVEGARFRGMLHSAWTRAVDEGKAKRAAREAVPGLKAGRRFKARRLVSAGNSRENGTHGLFSRFRRLPEQFLPPVAQKYQSFQQSSHRCGEEEGAFTGARACVENGRCGGITGEKPRVLLPHPATPFGALLFSMRPTARWRWIPSQQALRSRTSR